MLRGGQDLKAKLVFTSKAASTCTMNFIVEILLWRIEHANSHSKFNATFRPSRASSGIQYTER